jgi:hypothetical protein
MAKSAAKVQSQSSVNPIEAVYCLYDTASREIDVLKAKLKSLEKQVASAEAVLIPAIKATGPSTMTNSVGGTDLVYVEDVEKAQRASVGAVQLISAITGVDPMAGIQAQKVYDTEIESKQKEIKNHPKIEPSLVVKPVTK